MIRIAVTAEQLRLMPTGKTTHHVDGQPLEAFGKLELARFEGSGDVYLLYFGPDGSELTDTLHDSVEEALAQAEFEFGITRSDWRFLS